MKRLAVALTVGLIACSAWVSAEAIQKWRIPDGSLYFGDHPPPGATLLATYPETASAPITVIPTDEIAKLSQAAADGRDIIRRREEERAADRRVEEEREARQAELEARASYDDGQPFWFITSTVTPCRIGDSCFHHRSGDHHRHHGSFQGRFGQAGGPFARDGHSTNFVHEPAPFPRRFVMQSAPPSRRHDQFR
jgi:hypothetical protein